jgi:hypothetical protein
MVRSRARHWTTQAGRRARRARSAVAAPFRQLGHSLRRRAAVRLRLPGTPRVARPALPGWALPAAGRLLVTLIVVMWYSSALWYFDGFRLPCRDMVAGPPPRSAAGVDTSGQDPGFIIPSRWAMVAASTRPQTPSLPRMVEPT